VPLELDGATICRLLIAYNAEHYAPARRLSVEADARNRLQPRSLSLRTMTRTTSTTVAADSHTDVLH
jgi:hypothetical protein